MALSKADLASIVAGVTAQLQPSAAEAAVSGGKATAKAEWKNLGTVFNYGSTGKGEIKAARRGDLFGLSMGRKAFYFEPGEAALVDEVIKAAQVIRKALLR